MNQSPDNAVQWQLKELATYFEQHANAILKRWYKQTLLSPDLEVVASLSRSQFNDHIPGVLHAYMQRLLAWPQEESAMAQSKEKCDVQSHGLERWKQGYQLPEMVREWGQLQVCLMDELEKYAANHPNLDPQTMRTARSHLIRLCSLGISDSTDKFWKLHQSEAAGQVQDLQKAMATLEEMEKARAEAWREAAHDLRGSLSVVSGATSMLDRDDMPAPVRDQFYGLVQKGVSSLHEMLNDLMGLARLEAGHEQPKLAQVDAGKLLRDFAETSLPLAQKRGLYLRAEGPENLLVEADKPKVQRILQNLLLNALKYTREGGVTLTWGLDGGSNGGLWYFCVQDTGPGMAGQPKDSLMSNLNKGSGSPEGRAPKTGPTSGPKHHALAGEGVGLSIVKRMCELLNGTLELETTDVSGTSFRVTLPGATRAPSTP